MLFRTEIPPVVSINEAIEIAKKFTTAESGKFVNGLLDRVKKELLRPARARRPARDKIRLNGIAALREVVSIGKSKPYC